MDVARDPAYLKATAEAVADFKSALEEFLTLHEVNHVARGIAPAILPAVDADPEDIAQLRSKVGRAAGRAMYAVPLTKAYIQVENHGAVDPIAAWQSMTYPRPLLGADRVLEICDQILGRLEAMELKAEAEAPSVTGIALMHPLVWGAAKRLWRDGLFRSAVASAAESLITHVRVRTGRSDLSATALWNDVFSAEPPEQNDLRLRWPGDSKDKSVNTMNSGLRHFASGVQMTLRNSYAHGASELPAQEALERLAALSLLARWVDECWNVTV